MNGCALPLLSFLVATWLIIVCLRTFFPAECPPPYCIETTPRLVRASTD